MIRLLDELTDLEKLALTPLSYSRVNTYDMCEAMYYYQYIQKEETLWGAPAKLGNVVHSVLEEQLERNKPISPWQLEAYMEEFEKQLLVHDEDSIITEPQIESGYQMLEEFLVRHEGEKLPIFSKEYPFEIVIGQALFRGFIDRVDVTNEMIYITDYKSGRKEVTYKGVKDNLQVGIYAMALRKLVPNKPIYAELYYLKSGRQKGHLFTDDDLDAMEARLLKIVDEILTKRHFQPNGSPAVCGFCDFAKTEVCKVGARRAR